MSINIKSSLKALLIAFVSAFYLGFGTALSQAQEDQPSETSQVQVEAQAIEATPTPEAVSETQAVEVAPAEPKPSVSKTIARKQKQLQDNVKILQQRWHQAMRVLKHSSEPAPMLDAKGKPMPNNPHASISVALEQVLEQFRYMPEPKLRAFLNKKFALREETKWLINHPRLVHLFTKLLRSKTALPQFFSILEKREKLVRYSLWVLATFVLSFLLRYWIRKAHPRFLVRLATGLGLFIFFNALRIGLFVYQFYPELSPTIELARQV